MNDSHTHLDSCGPPNAELVAAAAREGVTRILTVGMEAATNRTALLAAEDFPQVHTAIGRHPNHAQGFDGEYMASSPQAVRSGVLFVRRPKPAEVSWNLRFGRREPAALLRLDASRAIRHAFENSLFAL